MEVDLSSLAKGIPLDPMPELYPFHFFLAPILPCSARTLSLLDPPYAPSWPLRSPRPQASRHPHQGGVRSCHQERPQILPQGVSRQARKGVRRGARDLRSHLHVQIPPHQLRNEGLSHLLLPRQVPSGRRHPAHDHEQPRQESCSVPPWARHLRRQRFRPLQLGSVPPPHEVPQRDDRRADPLHVLWSPHGPLPLPPWRSQTRHHQRYGHPQLLLQGHVREDVRPGRYHVCPAPPSSCLATARWPLVPTCTSVLRALSTVPPSPSSTLVGMTPAPLSIRSKYLHVDGLKGKVYVSSGLGGMSGAQVCAGPLSYRVGQGLPHRWRHWCHCWSMCSSRTSSSRSMKPPWTSATTRAGSPTRSPTLMSSLPPSRRLEKVCLCPWRLIL